MGDDWPERKKEAALGGIACCLKARAGTPVLIAGRCIAALELDYKPKQPTRLGADSYFGLVG